MSSPTAPAPIRFAPPAPNAWHAFGGIWRLTFRRFMTPTQWLVFAGAVALLLLITFAHSRTGNAPRYYGWLADFYLTFLTPALAFVAAAGSIRDDLKPAVTDYVLIRPVRRPLFVLFKFLSHVACMQIAFLITLLALVGLGVLREIPSLGAALPALIYAQALTVLAFSAFGFLCGAYTGWYFILGLAYAGLVEVGVGSIPTQVNRLSMLRQVNLFLHTTLPRVRPGSETQDALTTAVILVSIAAVMVAATAALLAFRELGSAPARE